jgi:hypothetical protein
MTIDVLLVSAEGLRISGVQRLSPILMETRLQKRIYQFVPRNFVNAEINLAVYKTREVAA